MKIWVLTNDYPPSGFGIGKYVQHNSYMLAERGHEVTVFVRSQNGENIEKPLQNIRVIRYLENIDQVPINLDYYLKSSWIASEAIIKQIEQEGNSPDIIEVQDCMALGYFLLNRKELGDFRLQKTPIVVHLHGPRFKIVEKSRLIKNWLTDYILGLHEKSSYALASAILAPTKFIYQELKEFVNKKPRAVIPLPFRVGEQNSQSIEKEIDILYFGRFELRKGLIPLLAEISALWAKNYRYKLYLIGEDAPLNNQYSVKEYLQKKYNKYCQQGLLNFLPEQPEKEINKYIRKAKIIVIPSLYDNFPLACVEAMSFGAIVLAADTGGQKEIVGRNWQAGIFYSPEKNGDLQNKILKVFKLKPESIAQLKQQAIKRIKKICSYENIGLQKEKYFQQLIIREKQKKIFSKQCIFNNKVLLSRIIVLSEINSANLKWLKTITNSSDLFLENIVINLTKKLLKQKYKNTQIINNPEISMGEAKNLALNKSRGKYFTMISPGQVFNPDYYKKLIMVLERRKYVYGYTWQSVDNNIHAIYSPEIIKKLLPFALINKNYLIKKAVLKKIGGYDQNIAAEFSDLELFSRLIFKKYKGFCLPDIISENKNMESTTPELVLRNYEKIINKNFQKNNLNQVIENLFFELIKRKYDE